MNIRNPKPASVEFGSFSNGRITESAPLQYTMYLSFVKSFKITDIRFRTESNVSVCKTYSMKKIVNNQE